MSPTFMKLHDHLMANLEKSVTTRLKYFVFIYAASFPSSIAMHRTIILHLLDISVAKSCLGHNSYDLDGAQQLLHLAIG